MTDPAPVSLDAPQDGDAPGVVLSRVGPGSPLASDSAFGVAVVTLWHRVSAAGGAVGFPVQVTRAEVAARVAGVVDDIRMGRLIAVAATVKRRLVGLVVLRPGTGIVAHTGWIRSLMVDPDEQGRGTGVRLMEAVIALARERGLELVDLSVRDGQGLESFYRRFGFTEWGRRPGWLRPAPGDDRDEIFLILRLADAPEPSAAQR